MTRTFHLAKVQALLSASEGHKPCHSFNVDLPGWEVPLLQGLQNHSCASNFEVVDVGFGRVLKTAVERKDEKEGINYASAKFSNENAGPEKKGRSLKIYLHMAQYNIFNIVESKGLFS